MERLLPYWMRPELRSPVRLVSVPCAPEPPARGPRGLDKSVLEVPVLAVLSGEEILLYQRLGRKHYPYARIPRGEYPAGSSLTLKHDRYYFLQHALGVFGEDAPSIADRYAESAQRAIGLALEAEQNAAEGPERQMAGAK